MTENPDKNKQMPGASALARDSVKRLNTRDLIGSGNEVLIEHENVDYRLRITSNGKLILTK
ncbi:MAG: hemin uptake protein HemP [Pseudomonadota bacterium]